MPAMNFSQKLDLTVNRAIAGELTSRMITAFEKTAREYYGTTDEAISIFNTGVWVIAEYTVNQYRKEWRKSADGMSDGYFEDVLFMPANTQVIGEVVLSNGRLWVSGVHNGVQFDIMIASIIEHKYATIIER